MHAIHYNPLDMRNLIAGILCRSNGTDGRYVKLLLALLLQMHELQQDALDLQAQGF